MARGLGGRRRKEMLSATHEAFFKIYLDSVELAEDPSIIFGIGQELAMSDFSDIEKAVIADAARKRLEELQS